MDSITNNKDALTSLRISPQNKTLKEYVPNEQEFLLINDYCDLLFPLKNLTTLMSGQRYCTISILFPAIYKLINFEINEVELKTNQCLKLKEILISSLEARFNYLFEDDTFLACTFLDFRMKNFDFLNNEVKANLFINRSKKRIIDFHNSDIYQNFLNRFNKKSSSSSSNPLSITDLSLTYSNSPLVLESTPLVTEKRKLNSIENFLSPISVNSNIKRVINKNFMDKLIDKNINFVANENVSKSELEIE